MLTHSPFLVLHTLVEGSVDNVSLLLGSQFNEVDSISADTDGKLGIFLGMFLGIQKGISVEYIYIQMMSALLCISVQ